jgi:ribosomal-protein-alanine N-acetyltransferase
MQPEDLQPVQAIDRISFSLPWPASAYRYELHENPNSLLWVAEVTQPGGDRAVAGMVVVWLIIDEAHIATIAVHPDYRGHGIAGELMAAALRGSHARGMLTATLEVRLGNQPAQNLYRRFQFEVVGRRPRYYRDNNEDALIMTLNRLDRAYLDWMESGGWKNHRPPQE